jgi:hypothetical protein
MRVQVPDGSEILAEVGSDGPAARRRTAAVDLPAALTAALTVPARKPAGRIAIAAAAAADGQEDCARQAYEAQAGTT